MSTNKLHINVWFDVALYEPYSIDSIEWREIDENFTDGKMMRFNKNKIKNKNKAKYIIDLIKNNCNFDQSKKNYLYDIKFDYGYFEVKIAFDSCNIIDDSNSNLINDMVMKHIWPFTDDSIHININGKQYEIDMSVNQIHTLNNKFIIYYYS